MLNICLNSVLILKLDENGAALASIICELIVSCLYLLYTNKKICKLKMSRDTVSVFVATIVMGIIVWLIHSVKMAAIIDFIVSIIAGVLIYAVVTIILKNSISIMLMNRIKLIWNRH